MNTKDIGDITTAMVLARLLKAGKRVLTPFGDNLPYDLAIDDSGRFVRVQCKTGRLENGVICFNTCTVLRNGGHEDYKGRADTFGVYCPENDTVYLVPVDECGSRLASLRVLPTATGQAKNIRWAADYKLAS